jgi:fructose-1,6-bisphosphatase/inositol monophosphatase family enzyme
MTSIIREAGGIITTLNGKDLKFNQDSTLIEGFVVSNNKIHDKIIEEMTK